jgi:hypothetical protein
MPIFNIVSPKMALLLILLIPLITHAKNENQVDKFAEAKGEPEGDIPVIKLEDIIAGKHSGKKSKDIEKNTNQATTSNSTTAKEQDTENIRTVKPTENSQSVDLEEAYSVLMNPDEEIEKAKNKVIAPATNTNKVTTSGGRTTGWLYLGRFSQGQWDNKNNQTLGLNATLPKTGQHYSLRIHSNIRNNYPSRGGMPAVRQVLSKGNKVRVLDIHNSGQSGHYWAKVEW